MAKLIHAFMHNIVLNRTFCMIVMLVGFSANTIPGMADIVGPYIKISLVWALALITYDFFTKRSLFKNRYSIFLLLFLVMYMISIVLNYPIAFMDNVKILLYLAVFLILFYGYWANKSRNESKKEINAIMKVLFFITFLLSSASIITFLFSINMAYKVDTSYHRIGVFEHRLYGLYNPNTGGMINAISIFISAYLLSLKPKKGIISLYLLNILIQLCCLVLTQSRSSWYGLIIGSGIFTFLLLPKKLHCHSTFGFKQTFAGILACTTVALCLYLMDAPLRGVLSYVPPMIRNTSNLIEQNLDRQALQTKNSQEIEVEPNVNDVDIVPIDMTREDANAGAEGGILSGRGAIWLSGLEAFKASPIFGVTSEAIPAQTEPYLAERWHKNVETGGLHNIYLTILLSSGVVGFAIMGFFTLSLLSSMIKLLVKKGSVDADWYTQIVLLFSATCMILFIEVFEARILYTAGFFSAVFWIICGWSMYLVEKANQDDGVDMVNDNLFSKIEQIILKRHRIKQ